MDCSQWSNISILKLFCNRYIIERIIIWKQHRNCKQNRNLAITVSGIKIFHNRFKKQNTTVLQKIKWRIVFFTYLHRILKETLICDNTFIRHRILMHFEITS